MRIHFPCTSQPETNADKLTFACEGSDASADVQNQHALDNAPADSPEANATRGIRLFCESGSTTNGEEEVLHLPVIVEAAESSPSAAAAAAKQIRIFLSREHAVKPYLQYNSVMLMRILSDNPGPSFSRNFDKAFVSTVKEVLRMCKDASTQQIMRETLDSFEANKQYQEGMDALLVMWRKEKGQSANIQQSRARNTFPMGPPNGNMYQAPPGLNQQPERNGHSSSRQTQLPPPIELASRIEEARNTAKILLQLVSSTPSEEVVQNELLREFSERCQGAQRSMQGYINCDNPPPDDDTMLTLIETNEQLSLATSRYQRSMLNARKAMGLSPSPSQDPRGVSQQAASPPHAPPLGPPPQQMSQSAFANAEDDYQAPLGPPPGQAERYTGPAPSQLTSTPQPAQQQPLEKPHDPFADPYDHQTNPAPYPPYNTLQSPSHPPPQQPPQSSDVDVESSYAPDSPQPTYENRTTLAPASRPGPSAWHNSDVTPSYIGRQASAADGLTMHGAGTGEGASEAGRRY